MSEGVGVMMCAWKEERMIVPAIRQFDNTGVSEVVVACSEKPWYGLGNRDNTAEIAVAAGATVRVFPWEDEKDQKNWIVDKLQDKEWILMFAPDMFMTKNDIRYVVKYLMDSEDVSHSCEMVTYWQDYETECIPRTNFKSLAIRPEIKFGWSSQTAQNLSAPPIKGPVMHHLSMVRTDEEMKTKITTWSHAKAVLPGWYETKWMDKDKKRINNFGLTSPVDWTRTEPYHLPDEIQDLIKRYERK